MANVTGNKQCPKCAEEGHDQSQNNLTMYDDGSTFCFRCNKATASDNGLSHVRFSAIESRKLTEETCRFFGYQIGKYTGQLGHGDAAIKANKEWVRIVNYYDDSFKLLRSKLKPTDKKLMKLLGKKCKLPLFGQWKFSPNPKLFITITEGEEDAMAIAQVQGYQYPVVSLTNGSGSAKKALEENLKYLMGFKYVVLAFDNDDAGKEAVRQSLPLFDPGKVRVAEWPDGIKDANEMLIEGREDEIRNAIFRAKLIEPEHLVTISDIIDSIMLQPQYGIPYPYTILNEMTYGFQLGEIHIIVAANGIGKTEYVKELMFHFLEQGMGVGLFSFEQSAPDTVRRLIGAKLGQRLHLPGTTWDAEAIKSEAMKLDDKLHLCARTGSIDIDELLLSIKFLARAKDKKLFIIDNIRGLGIGHDTELAGIFMKKLQTLCLELQVTVYLLSHVAKDKIAKTAYVTTSPKNKDAYESMTAGDTEALIKKPGMDWETGRCPSTENVDGPSVICDLANYVFALYRHKTSDDPDVSRILHVKALKTRLDGDYTGKTFDLRLSHRGRYEQVNVNLISGSRPIFDDEISQGKEDF